MGNSIKNGNLASIDHQADWWENYRQIDGDWDKNQILGCLHRLRRNFFAEFNRELFWLTGKGAGPDCWLYIENDGCRLERDMYHWIKGFLAHAYPVKATFVPGPEGEKDVHTEHCCYEHGCKYGHDNCTVAEDTFGYKSQSFPCEYCDGQEHPWGR